MTQAYSIPAITRTMRKGVAAAKKNWKITKPVWIPNPTSYQTLIANLYGDPAVLECEVELSSTELRTKATTTDVAIDLVTLLRVGVNWVDKGTKDRAGAYEGVRLVKGFQVLDEKTVVLFTKSRDLFYMRKGLTKGKDDLDMAMKVTLLHERSRKANPVSGYDAVIFPTVAFDRDVDMKPLLDMELGNVGTRFGEALHFIAKCSKYIKFSMDTVGAKVAVEVKMCIATKSARPALKPQVFVIDKPFTLWAVKAGCTMPYFAASIDADALTSYKG